MGSVFTCKLNPCCGDRYNCEPPRQYGETYDDKPAASPQPVAPTGEIAGLVARLNKAAAAITNQREHIRKQAEDIMTLGRLVYPKDGIGADDTWKARCAASEAEAADLRRKLEEARKALEPFATVGEIFHESAGWSDTDEIALSLEDGPRLAVVKLSHFRRALSEREGQA